MALACFITAAGTCSPLQPGPLKASVSYHLYGGWGRAGVGRGLYISAGPSSVPELGENAFQSALRGTLLRG